MWKATWDIFHNKVSTILIFHIVMPKMSKITHNFLCKKCQKSRYFCGRIWARISGSRKVYEVFHVWGSGILLAELLTNRLIYRPANCLALFVSRLGFSLTALQSPKYPIFQKRNLGFFSFSGSGIKICFDLRTNSF